MKLRNNEVAVLIPAHNEEKVIKATIRVLLPIVVPEHIYVVDDGSTDGTVAIARTYTKHVMVQQNAGKAAAMNNGIRHYRLASRYKYILPMDADTKITASYVTEAVKLLERDKRQKIACVVGKVIGKGQNWITSYRLWEYEVAQSIHKPAQTIENAVIVCSGCATIYRSEVFAKVTIPDGTMTEDMDFTFLIHRKNLGKIVFAKHAIVVTQDPISFKDYVKQIDRWYTGFWQCLTKHNIPWGGQMLDLEVGLLATEGLFNGALVVALLFLLPFVFMSHPTLFLIALGIDFFLFMLPSLFITAKRNKLFRIFLYLPHFYMMRFVSSLVFLKSFVKVLWGIDLGMSWNKATRYRAY